MINTEMLMKILPFFIGYVIVYFIKKIKKIDKIDDLYFYGLIGGLIGARLSYAVFNVGILNYDWTKVYMINQYNLNKFGGITIGLLIMFLLLKRYDIDYKKIWPKAFIVLDIVFMLIYVVEIYQMKSSMFYLSMTSETNLIIKIGIVALHGILTYLFREKLSPYMHIIMFYVLHILIWFA